MATRDKLFVPDDGHDGLLRDIGAAGATEAAVLSTCARTEIHAIVPEKADGIVGRLTAVLARFGDLDPQDFADQMRRVFALQPSNGTCCSAASSSFSRINMSSMNSWPSSVNSPWRCFSSTV